ncbi:MAG: nitroreductase family protein [Terrimicrobiaceae bacterium]
MKWRYATKQFDPQRKIDSSTWATLEEALILSPSSFGLQPWSGFWTVAACPAGYRAQEDKHSALPKVRFSKEEIINYLP